MIQLVRTLAIRKTIKRPTEFARYAFREARQDLDACITIQTELFQLVRLDESTNMMGTELSNQVFTPNAHSNFDAFLRQPIRKRRRNVVQRSQHCLALHSQKHRIVFRMSIGSADKIVEEQHLNETLHISIGIRTCLAEHVEYGRSARATVFGVLVFGQYVQNLAEILLMETNNLAPLIDDTIIALDHNGRLVAEESVLDVRRSHSAC